MILKGLLLIDAHRPPALGWLRMTDGRIAEIGEGSPREQDEQSIEAMQGEPPLLICPGFIDAHIHLPQIDSIGCDGMELLEWLDQVIFPAEGRWEDEAFAAGQIGRAYQSMLRAGTLGFAGYLTSHFHGYIHAVRAGQGLPLRAVVGQMLMDRNAPPQLFTAKIARIASSERSRVQASINPRFLPACSESMLQMAASKMRENTIIQTHLAESRDEVDLVHTLFPSDPHGTAVLDRFGLLTPHTLLAHCVHLDDAQWALIAKRGAIAVHCPTANVFLRSGLFNLDQAREHGVRVAVGSDVAAGADVAMPRVARAMIETAKIRALGSDSAVSIPSPAEAWECITRGNADALGWSDAGKLEIGAAADLLLLQLPEFFFDDHLIGRIMYSWDDRMIVHRMVAGRLVSL